MGADDSIRIAGIGASAGGLEALEEFFRAIPEDTNLGFVVVQHLSPDYRSLMTELLSKYTGMGVHRAEDGMEVAPNNIYLITPRKNLTIYHHRLYLSEQDHSHGLNLPIDIFLRSLAEDQGEKAIAIILSGTGSDGSLGIRAIKGAGGLVFAQDNTSAKFDGMPRSASSTGMVDYVLSPRKIAGELTRLIRHPLLGHEHGKSSAEEKLPITHFSKILAKIRDATGMDFSDYKETTILRRIERRIGINRMNSIEEYVQMILSSPKEVQVLYKDLLIGVTRFFRDPESFEYLKERVLPALFKRHSEGGELRVWCMGCSTGEEAYSLAILFDERMKELGEQYDVKIFATDIDRESIEYAGLGVYPESIVTDVSQERLQNYFLKKQNTFQVKAEIRGTVVFANHNVMKDPPFSSIDLVSCRNMLIYLKPEIQQRVLRAFHFSLREKGILFLGSSETVGDLGEVFKLVDNKSRIYRCITKPKRGSIGDYFVPPVQPGTRKKERFPEKIYRDHEGDSEMLENAYEYLLGEYVPPAIIIDDNLKLYHVCRDVSSYIRIPTGQVTLNVLELLPDGIKAALSTAVHKSLKEGGPVFYRDLTIRKGENSFLVDISVRPVMNRLGQQAGYYMVIFEDRGGDDRDGSMEGGAKLTKEQSTMISDLEQELQFTKENLQATIEELETSNEELQATNEELIASNEELQSTNEELQSVNEELYTVNSEYQNKIEELTQANNDLKNYLNNTDIGMIFLDKNMKIRKYTPAVTEVINIMEMDIGRPIDHITRNMVEDENFIEHIRKVLSSLTTFEKEITTREGKWFEMKILPYRTVNNVVEGIVITFHDINEKKHFQQTLENERNLLLGVLEHSPVGETMVDEDGRIVFVNQRAAEIFGLSREEILSRAFNDEGWKITDCEGNPIPSEDLPFTKIVRSKNAVYNYRHSISKPDGELIHLVISGSPVFNSGENRVSGAVFSFVEDMTGEKN